jgi:hypothetical protein
MTRTARLALDIGLLLAFLVAFVPTVTGISVHEWLSLAIVVPALVHLVINWEWVMRVAARLFASIRAASKVNLVVDALLFGASVTVMLSGLMVSQVIAAAAGVTAASGGLWSAVHALSAYGTMTLLAVHFALHASWIARTIRGIRPTSAELAEVRA